MGDKQTILAVDDLAENIDLLVGLLRDRYKVKAARNGEVALKIARLPEPPDLILLDIVMPGMDGFDVCEALKASPETANIPVIFLSAEVGAEERKRGLELGAVGYLTKPVLPEELDAAIASALVK